jgi:hypothetical protein
MTQKSQRGFSLPSLLLFFLALGFALTVFLKLFPIYQDNILIQQALKSLAEKHPEDLKDLTKGVIASDLAQFYTLNNVRGEAADTKHLKVEYLRDKTVIRVDYEIRVPFVKNVDLVVWFKNELDSSKPQECCKASENAKK